MPKGYSCSGSEFFRQTETDRESETHTVTSTPFPATALCFMYVTNHKIQNRCTSSLSLSRKTDRLSPQRDDGGEVNKKEVGNKGTRNKDTREKSNTRE
jgi:hypothetical protein